MYADIKLIAFLNACMVFQDLQTLNLYIRSSAMCKCIKLYARICTSKSNEPNTYQDYHLWIREYKRMYQKL